MTQTRRGFLKAVAAATWGVPLLGSSAPRKRKRRTDSGPIKILELNDMHITGSGTAKLPFRVAKAMNKEGGDLVLVCGDLAHKGGGGQLKLAKQVLASAEIPAYPAIGNHDAMHSGDQEERVFKEIFELENTSYHFKEKGINFIALDHGFGKKGSGATAVSPPAMAWLKKTLAKIPGKEPIVLFSHYPFGKNVRYRTPCADNALALFKNHRLLIVSGGHYHGNTERTENGTLLTTTACSGTTRGNMDGTTAKGYRIFKIDTQFNVTTEFREVR